MNKVIDLLKIAGEILLSPFLLLGVILVLVFSSKAINTIEGESAD